MLLQFSVENFLSFRDEVVLNLSAAESVRHPDRGAYAETEGGLFLRCAALYGANASGKSNLIRALETARQLVVRGTQPEDALDVIPFRLDESLRDAPSRFTFHVALAGKRYEYSIEVDRQRVVAEHLYQTDEEGERLAFERSTEGPNAGIRIGPALGANAARSQFLRFVAEGTRPNQPFLAEARQRNVGELAPLSNWLDRGLLAVGPTSRVVQDLEARLDTDDELRRAFGQLLQKADVGISDLSIEHQPLAARYSPFVASPSSQLSLGIARSDDRNAVSAEPHRSAGAAKPPRDRAFAGPYRSPVSAEPYRGLRRKDAASGEEYLATLKTHRLTDRGQRVTFDLSEESDGTRRLLDLGLALFPGRLGEVTEGTLLIDELERSLHPLLCRFFVNLFLHTEGAERNQLIFTTHDTNLLNRSLLPPDAIWFVQKDARGASRLYSLAEFKAEQLRELTGTLEEGYLQGRFGAIPFLGDPTSLGWHTTTNSSQETSSKQGETAASGRSAEAGDNVSRNNAEGGDAETDDAT